MPSRQSMTWEPKSKRWYKRFKVSGSEKFQTFCVSAKRLAKQTGCQPTMGGSQAAANDWWDAKQAELEASSIVAPSVETQDLAAALQSTLRTAAAAKAIGDRYSEQILRTAAAELRRRLEANEPITTAAYDRDTGELRPLETAMTPRRRLAPMVTSARESLLRTLNISPVLESGNGGKTVGELIKSYLDSQRMDVEQGIGSVTRYAWLRVRLRRFEEFAGKSTSIDSINGGTLKDYRKYLLEAAGIGRWYAHDCLSVCKTFLRQLWECEELAELPRNINSRSLQIPCPECTPQTFTIEEVKTMLEHAPERLRLYLLLMLNGGFTAKDVSDLHPREVDWANGTICRKRSKMKHSPTAEVVTYPLWRNTLLLLAKCKSDDPNHVLLNCNGKPLVSARLNGKDDVQRNDYIALAFRRFLADLKNDGIATIKKPSKVFRKTSATLLEHRYSESMAQRFTCPLLAVVGKPLTMIRLVPEATT